MKLQTLAAMCSAVATLTIAGAAFADDAVTVKLEAPVAAKTKVIAGGAVFLCEADACVASTTTSRTFAASTCKDLAKSVGRVSAFTGPRKALDGGKLEACNTGAAVVAAR